MTTDARTAQWKHHSIDEIGITFEMFADGDTPTTSHDYWRQERGQITLFVSWGAWATFDEWWKYFADTPADTGTKPKRIRFCDHTALAHAIETPDEGTVTGKTRQGKGIHTPHPAGVQRVVAFEHRGTPILVRWGIDLDAREANRALEDRFFGSVTCVDEPKEK